MTTVWYAGYGSCSNDCDCPPCKPVCATTGMCQTNAIFGRRQLEAEKCRDKACPQLVGGVRSQACNQTFIVDSEGEISCEADSDCPHLNPTDLTVPDCPQLTPNDPE